jgi:hypothetical protein
MTKYFHIVQVHPVENGESPLYKVEYLTKKDAEDFVAAFNDPAQGFKYKAVYLGCVNDETGELV